VVATGGFALTSHLLLLIPALSVNPPPKVRKTLSKCGGSGRRRGWLANGVGADGIDTCGASCLEETLQ
jgi:hypothetical protein